MSFVMPFADYVCVSHAVIVVFLIIVKARSQLSDFEYNPAMYPMFYDYNFGQKPCSMEGELCLPTGPYCCTRMMCAEALQEGSYGGVCTGQTENA